MDPIWQNPSLLAQALANAKALSAAGGNRSVVPMNQPPEVPNAAAKQDFLGINGAPGDPTVGMAPRVHPFQGVPLPPQLSPEADDQGTPPMDPNTADRNVLDPTKANPIAPGTQDYNEYRPEDLREDHKPTEMNAGLYGDVKIEPAASKYDSYEDYENAGGPESTPVAAATDSVVGQPGWKEQAKSFFNNPASTDALLAFSGAMLQAPNFSQGLGAAAEAVRKSIYPYNTPMSLAERQRMELQAQNDLKRTLAVKALTADSGDSGSFMSAQDGYATINGKDEYVPRIFNGSTGKFEYQLPDGSKTTNRPDSWTRATDSEVGHQNKQDVKDRAKFQEQALAANDTLQRINTFEAAWPTSGSGAGAIAAASRWMTEQWGGDLFGIDISNMQTIQMGLQDLNLKMAQSQRGLGQLTEGERAIIARALPQASTDRGAFMQVMAQLRKSAERTKEIYRNWRMDANIRATYSNINDYAMDFVEKANASDNSQGARPSLDSIFGNKK